MVTPKTGNPRGRRPKTFRLDPDRYAIAFALALQVARGMSEAAAFNLAAALFYGTEVEPEPTRRRQPAETAAVAWSSPKKPGAVGLPNKATTLRLKSNRGLSEQDAHYQSILTTACAIALGAKDNRALLILDQMLATIGEREFGERCLVPIILEESPHPI
jgi:hypothetical protein